MRLFALLFFVVCTQACNSTPEKMIQTKAGTLSVEGKPSEVPAFRRTYKMQLDNRAHLEMEARTFLSTRIITGTLTQPDGRSVYFDPERIADKILDPVLVPLVEAGCAEILRIDKEFIASKPPEFVDTEGTVWTRKHK